MCIRHAHVETASWQLIYEYEGEPVAHKNTMVTVLRRLPDVKMGM